MKNDHIGRKSQRSDNKAKRVPTLGYYMIFTNAEETEQNYINGLKRSIPEELRGKLVVKVVPDVATDDLVDAAMNFVSQSPQYGEPWIILDRDKVKDFDKLIATANKYKINVGWSNPCIEMWFHAYFGSMPTITDSVTCCDRFTKTFEQKTRCKYLKNDDRIYEKLVKYGDEQNAIRLADKKLKEHISNDKALPSEQCPASTVYILVDEIKSKSNI